METTALIECRQLVAAIDDNHKSADTLDFSAPAGSIVTIIGPDHTGKSNWLKTIAGIEPPVCGELRLFGKNTEDFRRADWVQARTGIAYVNTDTTILSAANALQNVMLPAVYHNMGDAQAIKQKALDLLDETTSNCDYEILPAYLRKDQRFRIAIARALILEPKVLMLDKPFTALDQSTASKLKQFLLGRVRDHQLLLIIVTHDIKFALRHSNQIIFMSSKQIHQFEGAEHINSSEIPEVRNFLETAT